MLYLVDGYNVTKSDPATRDLILEDQRSALVRRLAVFGAKLLGPGEIVVVFDGMSGVGAGDERVGAVKVTYALSVKADDEIVARAARAKGSVTVVSNDGGIRRRVRGDLGDKVKVVPSETCFESARERLAEGATGSRRMTRDTGLPDKHNEITEEMKRLFGVEE